MKKVSNPLLCCTNEHKHDPRIIASLKCPFCDSAATDPEADDSADVLAAVDAFARVLSIFGAFNVGMDPGFKRYFDFKPSDSFNALMNVLYSPPKNGQNKSKAYFLPRR